MSEGKLKRVCVFCGATPLTKEHIWPQWLRQLDGPREVMNRSIDRSAPQMMIRGSFVNGEPVLREEPRGKKAPVMDATVRVACLRCNGGWMSELENRAKPILTVMMGGAEVTISAEDVATISAWAFKTAAMYQFNDEPTRAIRSDALAEFRQSLMPDSSTRVYIFWCATRNHSMRLTNNGTVYVPFDHAGPPTPHSTATSTMLCVDRVGFLVTYSPPRFAVEPKRLGLKRIWPSPRPLVWPINPSTNRQVQHFSNFMPVWDRA